MGLERVEPQKASIDIGLSTLAVMVISFASSVEDPLTKAIIIFLGAVVLGVEHYLKCQYQLGVKK